MKIVIEGKKDWLCSQKSTKLTKLTKLTNQFTGSPYTMSKKKPKEPFNPKVGEYYTVEAPDYPSLHNIIYKVLEVNLTKAPGAEIKAQVITYPLKAVLGGYGSPIYIGPDTIMWDYAVLNKELTYRAKLDKELEDLLK